MFYGDVCYNEYSLKEGGYNMKKIILILLCLVMLCGVISCDNSSDMGLDKNEDKVIHSYLPLHDVAGKLFLL